jgi:Telomere resolvase
LIGAVPHTGCLPSEIRTDLQKGMGLMALTGRRPAEIFFSASFSLPPKKLPYPAILFDGQRKTRQAPGTSSEPYLIPVLADPKKLVQALDTLRDLKSFPSPAAVNTTTGPQLPSTFPPPSAPWNDPGNQSGRYLSLDSYDVLGATRMVGTKPAALSPGKRFTARTERGIAGGF